MSRSISNIAASLFLLSRNDDTRNCEIGNLGLKSVRQGGLRSSTQRSQHHDGCEIASNVLGRKGAMDDEWPSHGGQSRKSPWLLG